MQIQIMNNTATWRWLTSTYKHFIPWKGERVSALSCVLDRDELLMSRTENS